MQLSYEDTRTEYSEETLSELQTYRTRRKPQIRESREIFLSWLNDFALNSMELCRVVNGFKPDDFHGCNYTVKEKPFYASKGQCQHVCRGCRISSSAILARLKKLKQDNLIDSVKIQWLDGRGEGAVSHLPTDIFRIWFKDKSVLSRRLIQDVKIMVGEPDYL